MVHGILSYCRYYKMSLSVSSPWVKLPASTQCPRDLFIGHGVPLLAPDDGCSWDCYCRVPQSLGGKLYTSWTVNMWGWSVGCVWMGWGVSVGWGWGGVGNTTLLPELSRTSRILNGSVHPNPMVLLGALISWRRITQENHRGSFVGTLWHFLWHITTTLGCVVRALPLRWPWVKTGWILIISCVSLSGFPPGSPLRQFWEPSLSRVQLSGELLWVPWTSQVRPCGSVPVPLLWQARAREVGPMKYGVSYPRVDEGLTAELCSCCWVVSRQFHLPCLSMPNIASTGGTRHWFW